MILKVSHIEESTSLLGPYDRFVIWVHGCCFDCKGCLAFNTRFGSYKDYETSELSAMIVSSQCEGITISGGEPFLQVDSLLNLIVQAKEQRDLGIIIYSGFTLAEIEADENRAKLLPYIDVLIDGRYEESLDDGRAYVGSSNQVIHYLSSRYLTAGKKYYSAKNRQAEIKITPSQIVLIGVPSKNVLKVWQDMKQKSGGDNCDF